MNEQNYYQVQNRNLKDVGIKGNFEKNCVNDLFFSQTNIDALQKDCTVWVYFITWAFFL